MAQLTLVYWRDIPAQVIVKAGRQVAKRRLSDRFQQAIDRAAMRGEAGNSDSYLSDWVRSGPRPCEDDIEREATTAAERLECSYDDGRLARLVAAGGREDP